MEMKDLQKRRKEGAKEGGVRGRVERGGRKERRKGGRKREGRKGKGRKEENHQPELSDMLVHALPVSHSCVIFLSFFN